MSALADHLADYLELRRAVGYRLVEHGRQLAGFVTFCEQREEGTVTITTAIAWASSGEASPAMASRRLQMLRGFARYLLAVDPATEVPPVALVHAPVNRTPPYVFTAEEVAALIGAARRLEPPLLAATMATAIGLLAATGMRTGEAVALNDDDADLSAGMLTVRDSKWHKSRHVPIHPTTVEALRRYRRLRDQTIPAPPSGALLVTAAGSRLTGATLGGRFRVLLAELGIQAPAFRRPPRLADLRHTFAITTLMDWHAAGADVQARLPILSTYLGHLTPAATYWYLEAAPELMAVIAQRVARATGAAT